VLKEGADMPSYEPFAMLDDARVLARYAGRKGLSIPQEVIEAIKSADEKIRAGSFAVVDELSLGAAIASLAKEIAPVRIEDLNARGEMTPTKWLSIGLTIFSLVLVVLIIKFTMDFSKLGIVVSDINGATQNDYFGQIAYARNLIEKSTTELEFNDTQKNALKQIRDIDGRLSASISTMQTICPSWFFCNQSQSENSNAGEVNTASLADAGAAKTAPVPDTGAAKTAPVPDAGAAKAAPVPDAGAARAAPVLDAGAAKAAPVPDTGAAKAAPVPDAGAAKTAPVPDAGAAKTAPVSNVGEVKTVPVPMVGEIKSKAKQQIDQAKEFAVDIGLGINDVAVFSRLYYIMRNAENMKLVLGGSILPLLYGGLGSAVYILRQFFVNRDRPNPDLTYTLGVVLRLGLGGVSGLAIGWFWTPNETTAVGEIATLTAPFAVAFLAGYSIELLFSILDRIIQAVNPNSPVPNPPV
jgi:hypothetical protein